MTSPLRIGILGTGNVAARALIAPSNDVPDVEVVSVASRDPVKAAVHGGFVEVRDNRVIILSDIAEMAGDIDVERARARASQLEEQLRHEHDATCEAMLRRDHVRIEVAGGLSGH